MLNRLMIRTSFFACLLIGFTHAVAVLASEDSSQDAVEKAASRATSVTVRLDAAGQSSSGILISKEGDILTVNHGLPASVSLVTVMDSSFQQYKATVVARDSKRDLALLKTTTKLQNIEPAIVSLSLLEADQAVLASGFPASEKLKPHALLRLGRATRFTDDVIRSTCQLTAGDSGGGLFDLSGQLVGINQKIGADAAANIHGSMAQVFAAFPSIKNKLNVGNVRSLKTFRLSSNFDRWQHRTFRVYDSAAQPIEATLLCHATLWNSDLAFTKLSEIEPRTSVRLLSFDDQSATGTVVFRDRTNDLAVLRVSEVNSPSLRNLSAQSPVLFQLVVSGLRSSRRGIIGRLADSVADSRAVLGCGMLEESGFVKVDAVSPNSAAAESGILIGDHIVTIDDQKITNLDDVEDVLHSVQPGDWLTIEIKRQNQLQAVNVQLQHDAALKLNRVDFLDGAAGSLSTRRSGFQGVIQHDSDLKPTEMGTALLNRDDDFLGINIAVHSREAVLAIPSSTLLQLIEQLEKRDEKQ